MLNYPRALRSPGMKTDEEQAMLITFPLLVSTPLEGLKRMTRVQKYKWQFKGKKKRLKPVRLFLVIVSVFSDVIGTLPVVDYQIWRVLPCLFRVF